MGGTEVSQNLKDGGQQGDGESRKCKLPFPPPQGHLSASTGRDGKSTFSFFQSQMPGSKLFGVLLESSGLGGSQEAAGSMVMVGYLTE